MEFLDETDRRINKLIASRLLSTTMYGKITEFSSEKLISSLVPLGIPLPISLEVLALVEDSIPDLLAELGDEDITTRHIREMVFMALTRLDPAKFSRSDIEVWSSNYARRYGSPNNRIKVILDNNQEVDLTYEFLQETLIPELITSILPLDTDDVRSNLISASDKKRIAHEILTVVQFLNVYSLHYDTLFKVAEDTALQPPHPWMGANDKIMAYDRERAKYHLGEMKKLLTKNEVFACRHSAIECLDHSCSALLAFYQLFMGTRPFNNLIRYLKLETTNPLLWGKLQIRQIEGDLAAINQSMMNFQILLSQTEKQMDPRKPEQLKNFVANVAAIFQTVFGLIEHRNAVESRLHRIRRIDGLNAADFRQTIIEIFASIPKFKQRKQANGQGFWFVHKLERDVFDEIKPRILILPIYTPEPVTQAQFLEALSYFEAHKFWCNTLIIPTNCHFSAACRQAALEATMPEDQNILLLEPENLRQIYFAPDRAEALSTLLLDVYDALP